MGNLLEISIQPIHPKEIKCLYGNEIVKTTKDVSITIGILKVSGEYKSGSKGAYIGEYLRGISTFVREYGNLDGMIIDMSELNYEWGNNLKGIVYPNVFKTSDMFKESWLGYKIIGSQKNKKSLESLFETFGHQNRIYISKEEALEDLKNEAKKVYAK